MAKDSTSTLTYVMAALLLASLVANYFLYDKSKKAMMAAEEIREECEGKIDAADCPPVTVWDAITFYGPPTTMDSSEAKVLAVDFKDEYKVPMPAGIITAEALSKIFYSGTDANAIGYVMMNYSAKGDSSCIAIGGMHVESDGAGGFDCRPTGEVLYLTDIWCPPGCVVTD